MKAKEPRHIKEWNDLQAAIAKAINEDNDPTNVILGAMKGRIESTEGRKGLTKKNKFWNAVYALVINRFRK